MLIDADSIMSKIYCPHGSLSILSMEELIHLNSPCWKIKLRDKFVADPMRKTNILEKCGNSQQNFIFPLLLNGF